MSGMADQQIKVRRKSERPFAMVPHGFARDPSLSDKAFRLWIVLQSHADFDSRDTKLFQSTLAEEMDCSRVTIWRYQTELVERQLLEIESGQSQGKPNVYVVLDPPAGSFTAEIPPISQLKDGVFHQRDTGSFTAEIQGVSPVKDIKDNKNSLNEMGDAVVRPVEVPGRVAELRDRISSKAVG